MQRLVANSRLSSAIQQHRPQSLGKLWLDCFNDESIATPGFVRIVLEGDCHSQKGSVIAFIDKNVFPPIILQYGCANVECTSAYIANQLEKSISYRTTDLKAPTEAFRVVNGRRDHLPGLTIDIYTKEHAVIGVFSEFWQSHMTGVLDILLGSLTSMKSISLACKLARGSSSYKSQIIFGHNSGQCEITEVSHLYLSKIGLKSFILAIFQIGQLRVRH